MADLKAEFEQAAPDVQKLPKKPDDKTLLNLYAFYKQATVGDVPGQPAGRLRHRRQGEVRCLGEGQGDVVRRRRCRPMSTWSSGCRLA